jgi:hypothetical protein
LIDSRTHDRGPSPEAVEFVRYCYRRRRLGWPELYDEMCGVASRGLYHGMGPDELSAEGIGFSLFEMQTLAALVGRVIAEERERRDSALTPSIVRSTPVFDRDEGGSDGEVRSGHQEAHPPSDHPASIDDPRPRADEPRARADEPRARADERHAPAHIRLAGAAVGA